MGTTSLWLSFSHFFFFMVRRPPRSTLFPTRRSSDLSTPVACSTCIVSSHFISVPIAMKWEETMRSEEHTSELQSQSILVCRLLLEKKKKLSLSGLPFIHTNDATASGSCALEPLACTL